MPLSDIKTTVKTSFDIPRFSDKVVFEKLKALVSAGGLQVQKMTWAFLFANEAAHFDGIKGDEQLNEILEGDSVSTASIEVILVGGMVISVERPFDRDSNSGSKSLKGSSDKVSVAPHGTGSNPESLRFAKVISLARKHFDPIDQRAYSKFLDEGAKAIYESREQDLVRLERMQENFFRSMTEFVAEQQKKQQEHSLLLETEYAARESKSDEINKERAVKMEAREAEVKRVLAEIDDRENRQARRDIYKELKKKLNDRSTTFELTKGTKGRRLITFWFTIILMGLFAGGFGFCFYKNVISDPLEINWIAVGSQVGFAIAFIGMATFFIRWGHQWFQKHADEEFKLKRLDLDIDRANWLVELAMEWKNITKSELPSELIDKLSRSLFVDDKSKEIDIHPAETLLGGIFGEDGEMNIGKEGMTIRRKGKVK